MALLPSPKQLADIERKVSPLELCAAAASGDLGNYIGPGQVREQRDIDLTNFALLRKRSIQEIGLNSLGRADGGLGQRGML